METLWMIIGWIVFGLVIGALARLAVPGDQPIGLLATIALGIVGSFLGGWIVSLIMGGGITFESWASWIGAFIGAVVLLLIYIQFARKNRHVT